MVETLRSKIDELTAAIDRANAEIAQKRQEANNLEVAVIKAQGKVEAWQVMLAEAQALMNAPPPEETGCAETVADDIAADRILSL